MRYLLITCLFIGIMTMSCKDSPVSEVSSKTAERELKEVPRKIVQEQYSSPDNIVKEQNDSVPITKLEQEEETRVTPVEQEKQIVTTAPKPKKIIKKEPERSAEIKFDDYNLDFGEIMQGDKVDHKFTFTNTGNAPLSITKAEVSCGCTTPSIPFMDIMPGEQGYIGVTYNSVGKEGEETPQITIFTNSKTTPNLVLKMKGYVKVPEKESEVVKDSIGITKQDSTKSN